MKRVLVVSPHPDDETLGCGGTLLKLQSQGCQLQWLIMTCMDKLKMERSRLEKRQQEIEQICTLYGFASMEKLQIPATEIDTVSVAGLVEQLTTVFKRLEPQIIFVPFCNDVHTDHYFTAKAVLSCCKWFRHPSIQAVLYYETLSETNFNLNSAQSMFRPNLYVDIEPFWEKKEDILKIYQSELGDFPFPRSLEAVEAAAKLRGSECGALRAEAFELLRGIF